MPEIRVTIPLSGQVSSPVNLTKGQLIAVLVPAITSADLTIGGAFDVLSGSNSFYRVMQPTLDAPSSGDLVFKTGPGSRMIIWPPALPTPSYIQLEVSAAQAAAREFILRYH